jgi:hypothetical protein
VGRAVTQGRVAAVEVEVSAEVMGHFQAGFFDGSKGGAVGQQLGFERAPTGFGSGDAGPASSAGVLAAAVGVNNQAWRGLAQLRACSRASSTSSFGSWSARCQPTTRREQASRQVARQYQ